MKTLQQGILFAVFTLIVTVWVNAPDNSLIDRTAHLLSDEINTAFQIFAHLSLMTLAYRRRRWTPFVLDVWVTGLQTLVVQSAKHFLTHPIALRPSGGFEGFPSGHAAATYALAFMLSTYYPRLWWLWYAIAALVSWSRVQTNAHTILQISAGMCVGLGCAYVVSFYFLRHQKKLR